MATGDKTTSSPVSTAFCQANYGAAKMALVGLMQTLALEGRNTNPSNCLAPTAATGMTLEYYRFQPSAPRSS